MIKKYIKLIVAIALIIIIVIATPMVNDFIIKLRYKKLYSEYVNKYAKEYGVDANLVYAIIKAESNFKEKAISASNAKGLMQLMYLTAKDVAKKIGIDLNEENILEPEININIGTKYISTLIQKYNCIEVALAAYNAGSGNVDKWIEQGIIKNDGSDIENIPYKETNNYVRKIVRDYKIYNDIDKN